MNRPASVARIDRRRFWLAVIVTLLPLLGTLAACVLWSQGMGPGYVGLGLFIVMYASTMLGLEVGYHRCLTHRSFVAKPALRAVLAVLGSMTFQGPVLWWAAIHRRHHGFTDREGDPHSPNLAGGGLRGRVRGLIHAHVGWMFRTASTGRALVENFPRDLQQDPLLRTVNRHYFRWVVLGFAIPTLAGWLIEGSWQGALIGALWGGFVRLFLTSQFAFALNSFCHVPLGARRLKTTEADQSRDLWLLVIPTMGQGYHNRHHAFPRVAVLGPEWWHFDLGGWFVNGCERLGWATDVKRLEAQWRHGYLAAPK